MDVGIVGIFGLFVGSFLNVCIHRVPLGRSIVLPRSACPACGHAIAFYDNIPLLSFLLLRGRCRHCRAPISWRYPAVETLNALLWVAVWLVYGPTLSSLLYAAFSSAMLVLAFIDAGHRILPHGITIGGLVAGLATAPWQAIHQAQAFDLARFLDVLGFTTANRPVLSWIDAGLGLLVGAGMLLIVAVGYYLFRKTEGMGHGDIIMMAFVGSVLGWSLTLLTIFLGSFLGALVGLILIRRAGGDRKYEIPFGTFLALAAVITLLTGNRLLAWYWNLL
jgi:leader peptidase (prepilin peptidase)/N-methyltransferase